MAMLLVILQHAHIGIHSTNFPQSEINTVPSLLEARRADPG